MKNGDKALVAEAEVEALSVEKAAGLLGDPSVQFVDVRDPRELDREGRMPGAFRAPRGMLEFWIDPESPCHKPVFASGKTLVFFCAGGLRSALATKTAQDMGLSPVKHIAGGFSVWKTAGLPVEQAAGKP